MNNQPVQPTKPCKHCGQPIPTTAIFCPHCQKRQKKGGCFKFVISMFIVLILFAILVVVLSNKFGDSSSTKRSELAEVMDLTEEQETAILSLFENCGIGELESVKQFQAGEDRTSYYIDDKETAVYAGADNTIVVWVENETKTVQEIYFHDVTIYADGEVQAQLPDYYISAEARDIYRVNVQLYMEKYLAYPDTAKYPSISGWRFGVRDGYDVVQSSVEAKNAFGMTNTMTFTVKFERRSCTVVSLVIDGQEYIK